MTFEKLCSCKDKDHKSRNERENEKAEKCISIQEKISGKILTVFESLHLHFYFNLRTTGDVCEDVHVAVCSGNVLA